MSAGTASAWRLRHEGSPRSIEGLNLAQIVDGLQEGLWEVTDEVMGPGDSQWVSIESHPQLASLAADVEPPTPPEPEDDTRLDMNPLIDVALVLLIVFILTMTYATLQKVVQLPQTRDKDTGVAVVKSDDAKKFTIKVEARLVEGRPVIKVEDKVADEGNLVNVLRQYVRETKKTDLLLDAKGVSWGTVQHINDAARGAGISVVHQLVDRRPK